MRPAFRKHSALVRHLTFLQLCYRCDLLLLAASNTLKFQLSRLPASEIYLKKMKCLTLNLSSWVAEKAYESGYFSHSCLIYLIARHNSNQIVEKINIRILV